MPLLLFIPLALFVGTEASGTRAFIGVIVISLLPELVGGALARAPRPVPLRAGLRGSPFAGSSSRGGSVVSVSVVITCHNEERTIEQAVRSVEAQTTFDAVAEIIVVNDGSQDGSEVVLERLAGEIEKLRIIETPGLGQSAARNRALREAKGELIAILDGDDFWTPEKLACQLPAFARGGNIGLVYGDFVDFSRDDATDGRIITVRRFDPESPHQLRDYFVHDGPIMPSTAVIRRSVFDDVGLFDESLRIGEDTEFYLRLAEKWRFCHVPGAFTFKRRHAGQLSWRLDASSTQRCRHNRALFLTPSGAPVSCRPPNGAASCEGQYRLCDEGRMAQGPPSHSHGDPPRAALLACLGQPSAFDRASVRSCGPSTRGSRGPGMRCDSRWYSA